MAIGAIALSLALASAAVATPALAGADDGGNKAFFNSYGVQEQDAAPAQAAPVYGADRDATATVQQYDQYRAQGRRVARRPVVSE